MKTKIYLTAVFGIVIQAINYAQTNKTVANDVTVPFNLSFWNAYSEKLHLNPLEKKEFISSQQKCHAHTNHNNSTPNFKLNNPNQNTVLAGGCINIDFENGNFNGWAATSGFHPLFNPLGCCLNPGGQQLVTSGTGADPLGGFPVVAPGGSFSLRLGDNVNGGEADRIEQTFLVSPANANFTYKYAVVFQDPGHSPAQQPAFQIEMIDSNNVQIPCTFYNVAAGGNIPGFLNSSQPGVIYKPWSSVVVDLTNFIGQNVTIRFTTYDCALGGHFGYAYIDGICAAFVKGTSDTVCAGATKNYCAPNGLGTYVWNGPGIVNNTNQCINASAIGVYTCQTTLLTGCTGPEFTYTLSNFASPVVSFNSLNANACAQQFTFTNTSSISSGSISNYNWNFGFSSSTQQNPVINFPNAGNYTVSLIATSNNGCSDSTKQNIAIYPVPNVNFLCPNSCLSTAVNFTNTSSISTGLITNYNWNFGTGNTSTQTNPSFNYSTAGTYSITLSATSNQGCIATATNTVVLYPMPILNFNANPVCFGNPSTFTNLSSIANGTITSWVWDFDNNGSPNSTLQSPTFIYPTAGNYIANLQAVSNNNCISSATANIIVHSNPTASFTAVGGCYGGAATFTNLSSIVNGNTITNYTWNFGNNTQSSQSNPLVNYASAGTYSVQLTATSNFNCNAMYATTVIVHSLPNVNFSSNIACKNQTTQFNNSTIINGGVITKWRWDFENDGIWDDTLTVNPSKVYPNYGNFSCKLQAFSNFQCASAKINAVIVHANPVAYFTTKPSCLGDVTTFTNLSTSADGAITSNQWDFNGDNITDNIFASPSLTYTANGTYLVKLEIQTQYGCTNVFSKSVYVNPKPQAVFTAQNKIGCPTLCVKFTNNSSIATGSIVTTQWQFGDGSLPDYTKNPTHCYGTGNYNITLKLVSDSGCITTLNQPNYVVVYPKPIAAFKVEPEEVDENEPNISVSTNATGASITNYYINDGSSFATANFNHTLNNITTISPIIFQVVQNQFGCADTVSNPIKIKPSFVIYIPNTFTPNGDGVNDGFFAKGVGITKFNIQIYDRWGHLLFETNDIENAWDGNTKNSSEPIKQDVYVWKAQVQDVFHKNHDLTGHVSLIK